MPFPWTSATLPKAGHRPDENEDAAAADPTKLRFAAADGASEGWQSGPWAAHLVRCYTRRPPTPADFPKWLAAVRKKWKPPAVDQAASWYAEAKQEQGAFATLLGVEFRWSEEANAWAWKAVAVGDTCLLVIRENRVHLGFPFATPAEFGNRPALVPSSPNAQCPEPEWLAGRAEPGDLFVLATDAAACGLLTRPELVNQAVEWGRDSGPTDRGLDLLRELQAARNDDVTLLVVGPPAAPEPPA